MPPAPWPAPRPARPRRSSRCAYPSGLLPRSSVRTHDARRRATCTAWTDQSCPRRDVQLHRRVGDNRRVEAIRQIVERADLDDFTERVVDSFWDRPEYQRFRPLREDVRAWVRWNIDLVIRWLVDDQPPTEADLERFRERAQMLAVNGMPPDLV